MRNTMVLTKDNFRLYEGECDIITHSPYRIGDRLCKCGGCNAVVKEEYIENELCPVCGNRFVSVPIPCNSAIHLVQELHRKLSTLWILGILAALGSVLPLCYIGRFISEEFWGLSDNTIGIITLCLGIATIVLIGTMPKTRGAWERKKSAFLMAGAPLFVPYAAWVLIKVVILVLQAIVIMLGIVFVIGILVAILDG